MSPAILAMVPCRVAPVLALAALATALRCTPSDPPARHADADAVAPTPRIDLGLMYWALPRYVLGDDHALVFGAVVEDTDPRPADRPDLRGDTIHNATLRVDRVLHQRAPADADPDRPPPRLRPGDLVTTDAADGVRPGDRILVFATAYEGSYAILPRLGTTTSLGIVVSSWSDPIVAASARWLAGTADFRNEADAAPWREYGAAAIDCLLDGVPVGHCDEENTSNFNTSTSF